MAASTVSSKFQIVIPKEVRNSVDLQKGQVLRIVTKGDVICLVPEQPLSSLRGLLKGSSTESVREKRDRI